jgi:Uri superfamily endonuclease
VSKIVNTIAVSIFIFAMLAFTLFVSGFFAYHGISLKGFIDMAKLPGYVNNFAEYRVHVDYLFSHVFAFSLLLMGIALMLCSTGIYKNRRYSCLTDFFKI